MCGIIGFISKKNLKTNFYNEKLRKIKMNFKQYAQYCICKILLLNGLYFIIMSIEVAFNIG